jgi:hypothetical protein
VSVLDDVIDLVSDPILGVPLCPSCGGELKVEAGRRRPVVLACLSHDHCDFETVRAALDQLADDRGVPRPAISGRSTGTRAPLTVPEALAKVSAYGVISAPRAYVDLAGGDRDQGAILGQIEFWSGRQGGVDRPDCDHKPSERCACPVQHWVAMSYDQIWDELRIKERSAQRAIATLRADGLIRTRQWLFRGRNVAHYRIVGAVLESRLADLPDEPASRVRQKRDLESARSVAS